MKIKLLYKQVNNNINNLYKKIKIIFYNNNLYNNKNNLIYNHNPLIQINNKWLISQKKLLLNL